MKKVAIILAVTLAAIAAEASDPSWSTDYEAAQKAAAKKNLPILADFAGSDWCGWCIRLDREVFSKKEFSGYAKDKLVLFLADFPSRKKQAAAEKKQNEALPKK
ncbi:MAG: thioredoxin family protein, partial [Lentisphaerae bacterium]|nr:thioredoxin family protein [Lentisphaerota bacterium]